MNEPYDAFISYSRANADLAERISRRLRLYRPPKQAGLGKRRLTIFRDVERFTASSDLSEALVERVNSADKLVLLCSPSSARSKYVEAEVRAMIEARSLESIIFVLLEGDLPEILPPSLRERKLNPLYIDLRDGSRTTFRNETLRLIAAIYGVDYAALRREDEARRRRRWTGAILTFLVSAFVLASAYLIASAEPIVWDRIEQPDATEHYEVKQLLPVHEIALNRKDPSIVLYLGQNAAWYADTPLFYLSPDWQSEAFIDRVAEKLKRSGVSERVAIIEFEVIGRNGTRGAGRIEIGAVLDGVDNPRFVRNLTFEGRTYDEQSRQKVDLPFALQESGQDPFALGLAVELLAAKRLIESNDTVVGTITDLIEGTTHDVSYEMDFDLEFFETREQAYGPEYKIFTNANVEQVEIEGARLVDHQYEQSFWEKIANNEDWMVYTPQPEPIFIDRLYSGDGSDEGLIEVAANVPEVGDERALVNVIEKLDSWGSDILLEVTLISTHTSTGRADLLKLDWFLPPVGTGEREAAGSDWVVRLGASEPWRDSHLPSDSVEGLWSLEEDGQSALLLTTDKGFFRTWDGGASWMEANYNETGFTDGNKVKTFVVDGASATFALIDRGSSAEVGENPLFRLRHRNWIERWKIGLIQLLQ